MTTPPSLLPVREAEQMTPPMVVNAHAVDVSLLPVSQMIPVLDEYRARRVAFRRWVLSQMKRGLHYGVPPGCEPNGRTNPEQWQHKPSLYKAGADMLCDLLKMRPEFEADEIAWKLMGSKPGVPVFRCRLINIGSPFFAGRNIGEVLGEGRGAAAEGQKKRDANAAIKVAQKCAKVDAVINTLGLSDLFTQDMDNEPEGDPESFAETISEEQSIVIGEMLESGRENIDRIGFFNWLKVTRIEDIPASRFEEVRAALKRKLEARR